MAVFFLNSCTYSDCRKCFSTLSELIYHIEEEHIDFSPSTVEEKERQKVDCIALSYVLKYSTCYCRERDVKDSMILTKRIVGASKSDSEYVLTEHDSILLESEISDDSWNDDLNNDFINNYPRKSLNNNGLSKNEYAYRMKKFVCPVPGCNKRYKNINGVKYHTKNGHEVKKSPIKPKKLHKCHCGKSYKTAQGLKAHSVTHKEINLNLHKAATSSNSHLLSGQKFVHTTNSYIRQNNMLNNSFINKVDIVDEDVLAYTYLEQTSKVNETAETNHDGNSHFGFFTPPYSYNNSVITETFSDNLIMEENINQNYQFSVTYRKY